MGITIYLHVANVGKGNMGITIYLPVPVANVGNQNVMNDAL